MSTYKLPAIRGIQAAKEYYVCMLPFKTLPEMFPFITLPVYPPHLRSQRLLNKSRLPAIKNYILDNRNSYAFGSIVISVDGDIQFVSKENNFAQGILTIPKDAKFVVNDGQHRIEAIKQALKDNEDLRYESISTVFYYDIGLKNSQQVFTDLNRYTVKPTPSISILYDSRDNLASLARFLVENVYYFKDLTEYEKTSISNRGSCLFTLSGIYNSTKELLGKKTKFDTLSQQDKITAQNFWTFVGDNIPEWSSLKIGETTSKYLRDNFIHSHNLFLNSIGKVGNILIKNNLDLKKYLRKLQRIDWRRENPEWEGVALNNGRLSKAKVNIDNTFVFILNKLEIETVQKLDWEGQMYANRR